MWYIWKARNDQRYNRKQWIPSQIHNAVAAHLKTHTQALLTQAHTTTNNFAQRTQADQAITPLPETTHMMNRYCTINPAMLQGPTSNYQSAQHDSIQGMQTSNAGPSQPVNRYLVHMPVLIHGVRCYSDASLTPDNNSQTPRTAGLGIFSVNTQVQRTQTIFIKAQVSGVHSVLMAEAAALVLAAIINERLNFDNTIFLSNSQILVHFLNALDHNNPPDWRIKPYTQMFKNTANRRHGKIVKINRTMNSTADVLAKQALIAPAHSDAVLQPVCSYACHASQCTLGGTP